jgi:hypothetical protein
VRRTGALETGKNADFKAPKTAFAAALFTANTIKAEQW